jgi:hypothetical protein
MISDKIDEMFAKKEEVKQILLNKNPNDKTDISSLSRLELINSVGL